MGLFTKIENIFKKPPEIRNCKHPDFAPHVEKAFVGAGVHSGKTQYYRFKGNTELDLIAGRYNKSVKFLLELSMRMDGQQLMFYMDKMEDELNSGNARVSELFKWISIVKERTKLLYEDETAMKLASASYFDETEELDSYDYEYNIKKIKAWKESGDYSFFFTKPMSDFLPLPKSWQKDFTQIPNYITISEQQMQLLSNLTS